MKKVLLASTALAAMALVANPASAAEKIKLNLGGFSKWWVVGAWNDDSYQRATGQDFNSVDIKGDNEIFFGGETTLDNGLKVGVNIELEAGGDVDSVGGGDIIDKSFVFVEGGFGKAIVGTESNGTVLLHVMAPDAAGNIDSDGILTAGYAIQKPANFNSKVSTSIDTDGEVEKFTYVAPTFYGLTIGGSYIPNASEDQRGPTNVNANGGEIYGVGALYDNTFGEVGVKISAGYVTGDLGATNKDLTEWSTGAQVSFGNFTVGGSYRNFDQDNVDGTKNDGNVWDAGIQYASGPYAVSFYYFQSKADSTLAVGDDKFSVYQVSGKYALGPGVDVLGTVGYADYDSASNADNNNNEGWAVMTGLSLAF